MAVVLINNSLDKIPDTVALASKTIASIENAGDGQGDAEHVVEERTEKILPLATDKTCHGAIEPLPRRPELN